MTIPFTENTNLSIERLLEIESVSEAARHQGHARWTAAYQETDVSGDLCPLWVELEALCFVAVLLVSGQVSGVPNLCVGGERLAGGIALQGQETANIFYEAYDPSVRQRFSIAHELGHFFLHKALIQSEGGQHYDLSQQEDDNAEYNNSSEFTGLWAEDPLMEREADAFAAAFLMPSALVVQNVSSFGHAIPFLARRYGVSRIALRKRLQILKHLGFFGGAQA